MCFESRYCEFSVPIAKTSPINSRKIIGLRQQPIALVERYSSPTEDQSSLTSSPLCAIRTISRCLRALAGWFPGRSCRTSWFPERFHSNVFVTHFQDRQLFCPAWRVENHAVALS